jgi:SAM-dependent methyltransferase
MTPTGSAQTLRHSFDYAVFRLRSLTKERFECPVCGYRGPFRDFQASTGLRKHAQCPKCAALERHRLQYLVMRRLFQGMNVSQWTMLHFAPEPFFRAFFDGRFATYETADLERKDVDHNVDLQDLPFESATYDLVFASHVLEHVPDDDKAVFHIRRILKPSGIAILPVPIVAEKTIEYPEPNPNESFHVRAPGLDYFSRYERHFARVERHDSNSFPGVYQLFVYEDRSTWPTRECPLRPAMQGSKHIDVVPVCYA